MTELGFKNTVTLLFITLGGLSLIIGVSLFSYLSVAVPRTSFTEPASIATTAGIYLAIFFWIVAFLTWWLSKISRDIEYLQKSKNKAKE